MLTELWLCRLPYYVDKYVLSDYVSEALHFNKESIYVELLLTVKKKSDTNFAVGNITWGQLKVKIKQPGDF